VDIAELIGKYAFGEVKKKPDNNESGKAKP
jgi:hypothetical protein